GDRHLAGPERPEVGGEEARRVEPVGERRLREPPGVDLAQRLAAADVPDAELVGVDRADLPAAARGGAQRGVDRPHDVRRAGVGVDRDLDPARLVLPRQLLEAAVVEAGDAHRAVGPPDGDALAPFRPRLDLPADGDDLLALGDAVGELENGGGGGGPPGGVPEPARPDEEALVARGPWRLPPAVS